MTDLLFDLLGYAYLIAIIGGIGWWLWVMRRAGKPRKRSAADEAELARLQAYLQPGAPGAPGAPAKAPGAVHASGTS